MGIPDLKLRITQREMGKVGALPERALVAVDAA